MRFALTNRRLSGIPVLELSPQDAHKKRSLIIMMHGLAARKENVLPYAYYIAAEGYHVVIFDAHDHGELETGQFKGYSDLEKKVYMFTVIFKSSKNINTIINAFSDNKSVDSNRVGLMGFSMGGMMVYDYISGRRSQKVKAGVAIIATPEWGKSIRRNAGRDPDYAKHFDEQRIMQIERRQPSNYLHTIKDFPLLILSGELDEIMPIEDTRAFYHRARQNYTQPDLIQLIEYKGTGHTPTFEMISDAITWLRKYL